MYMEEMDVSFYYYFFFVFPVPDADPAKIIKKRQPPPKKQKRRRRAQSDPNAEQEPTPPPIPEDERLRPFVDQIFGGKFASILVCEECKHVRAFSVSLFNLLIVLQVSHTYEDFMDVSLPIKPEEDKESKVCFSPCALVAFPSHPFHRRAV